jgi:chromosome segregation ATPase
LQEKEAAEASVAAAQKEIDSVERTCRPELDAVDGELADVDAQIAQLQRTPGDAAGSHQKHQQKSGKHQRKRQSEEERVEDLVDVEAEAEEDEPAAEPKARTKRRRLVKGG